MAARIRRAIFRAACSPAKSACRGWCRLFDKLGIPTSWFIPGHSIETFPTQCKMVVDAGHEIGMHGYSHENPIAMTPEQEEAVMDKCIELIERLVRPAADRLCRAVVGILERHQRAVAEKGHQIRPQPDEQ